MTEQSGAAEEPLVLTVEEAGRLLGISRGHAYKMARKGLLPTIRLGQRVIVSRARLLRMIEDEPREERDDRLA